jgi:dienelactone hydrolase
MKWFALGLALMLPACASVPAPAPVPSQKVACSDKLKGQAARKDIILNTANDRIIPVTIHYPAAHGTYPLIAFSHGAFASPGRYEAMLRGYAAAGYVVVAPMHRDSEEFPRGDAPPSSQAEVWTSRHEDFAIALTLPQDVRMVLAEAGILADESVRIAIGHSYGALIAQVAGGASPDAPTPETTTGAVSGVVAWSPPGPMPGLIAPGGWSSLHSPSLTITGTADVLPGFADDWRAHRAAFDNAPAGSASLWVGEGVDHYFGGVFGRLGAPDDSSRTLFERAMAQSLAFIEQASGAAQPCYAGRPISAEMLESR